MAEKQEKCISCKKNIVNNFGNVRFACPNCGKQEIIRCKECRVNAIKYKCPECGFEGPN